MSEDYRRLQEQVLCKLEAEIAEKAELEQRLADLKKEIRGLEAISEGLHVYLSSSDDTTTGITDAIRKVLSCNLDFAVKPTAIREHLRQAGFPIDDYSQPMAVIHTTLKRLKDQGEARSFEEKDGGTLYVRVQTEEDVPF